jgi:virulence factor Mce-like protein
VRRSNFGNLAASPTLVGAVTVLVVVVAVFLSYQANQGLPFVPTYKLSAELPNANSLVPGNEVRIGGVRVGAIESVEPVQNEDGSVAAKANLELIEDLEPLPEDTTMTVRSRSALGLKYLEIQRGDSERGFEAGSTIPLTSARPEPVEIDQVFNTFDDPTRAAIQANLTEFGNALAGRGVSLNAAIGDLRPLVENLEPVMRNLAAPETGLARFVNALSQAAAEVAPVADIQGQMFVDLERTFAAFADVARPYIQETISRGPETEAVAIDTLPTIRPFLANTSVLFTELTPGFDAIRPPISRLISRGTGNAVKALRVSPPFNEQLDPTAQALLDFNNDATVRDGLTSLRTLSTPLRPLIEFVGPAQSVCNYATLLFRNLSSAFSLGDGGTGNYQRFIVLAAPPGAPNSETSPSSAPASGGAPEPDNNFLHYNPYPNTASPGQSPRECEAGNEVYQPGQVVVGPIPGDQGIVTEGQLPEQLGEKKKKKKKKGGKK